MKTFLTHLKEYSDTLNPLFSYGGSSTGVGLGQYFPMADLNAQSEKEIKKSDLDQVEKYADRLFASLGIDVEFTRHFLDRVNDQRNVKQITSSELIRLFKQSFKKHGKTIAKLGPDAEAVINDMKTDINMPFVLNLRGGELELVAKTVMRKKNFKSSDKKLSFEEVNPRIPRKKGQPAGSKKHSDLYTDENPKGTIHGLGFKDVETARSSVNKIKSSGKTHAHKIQAAVAMEQRAKEMGKTAEANIYRTYIDMMKKKTKEMQKEEFDFFPKKLYERITLPNPPVDVDKEIMTLKKIMDGRTEEDEISIRNHDEHAFYAIEKYCEKNGLVFHGDEMKDIVNSASETLKHFKTKFNVTRPFDIDKSIKPMGSKTNKTKSYPSGHACQSRLVGLYVANKFPIHEDGVMEAAKECGIGRVLAGFHYLSDYTSGNLLADKMFLVMNRNNYGTKK
jgi:hypothetical protein